MNTEMKATEQYFLLLLFIMRDEILNPLSPKSDQHKISPCNINAL